ncbi:MAG: ADP-ribosylglycohydrolase family protein [Crocosphaera sp.]
MIKIAENPVNAGVLGVIVGDALGLPVQFEPRSYRDRQPVTEMFGYGVFNVPPGSWSDDSSLTLCLVDALTKVSPTQPKPLLKQISQNFCQWLKDGYLTPFGYAYDVGGTTEQAIGNLSRGSSPLESGETGERSNGNGSLMRILPLAFCYQKLSLEELIILTHQVGSITHGHQRSNIACGIYIIMAVELLQGQTAQQAYQNAIPIINKHYQDEIYSSELKYFQRILQGNIETVSRDEISSSGYVVHSLEAALWCLLTTNNYRDAVLKAVNLGDDTDTVAAITGGLAGIFYGVQEIPKHWLEQIPKIDEIINLIEDFSNSLGLFN